MSIPIDEESDNLSIGIDSTINNPVTESVTGNSYEDNNEEEVDETTSLLKPRGNEILTINDNSGTKIAKKKRLFSLKNFVVKIQNHITEYLRMLIHFNPLTRDGGETRGTPSVKFDDLVSPSSLPLTSLISIAAGFLFKPLILAGAVIIVGDLFGALGTFIFGRYIFSDWVKAQIEKKPVFNALNKVIAEEGWKIVVMLRLTPLPFNFISYFFSVSSIELFPFLWATVLGVLPGTFNAVWIGSLVKNLSGIDKPKLKNKDIVIITMNFILVGCCVIALSIFGKRSLRKAMTKLNAPENVDSNNDNVVADIDTSM
ncbi:2395_t:CDS:2 [Diversispora eburnea]|uniref:2395_t:CDS:1 n=1 Tax=Diversispora eburnea TaxID=1213867 RepID=A0A9N8WK49_9GLOM|nr:2395_t:CDS:2 [Diversispora eburnea]